MLQPRFQKHLVSTGQIMEAHLDPQLTSDESDKQPLPIHHFVYIFAVLQSSAFLSRDENEKEVGMVGAILIWKDGDEKRNRFSASDIWFMMIMSWLLTIRDIKYLLDSTNQIYIQTEDSLHNTKSTSFCSVLFSLMLRFCSLLTVFGQLDPIIRMFYPLNIKGQRVLLIPLPGEFLRDLSQYVVGAAAKHFPIPCRRQHLASRSVPASSPDAKEQRTWKDYSYL